ncbi:hypothetical protein CEXT_806991 [Caerostris extrusa]|uniref:Uncharacterized protein n=1 Tax=Caerostris extrusa TaxID=172846 RepID=A0AAV4W0N6_CAEEX|nr:hypothetical protein CEXT_806991 [Caerostris extrusa]
MRLTLRSTETTTTIYLLSRIIIAMAQYSVLYIIPKLTQACSGLAAMFLMGHLFFSTDYTKIEENKDKSKLWQSKEK